jgi:predicted amidohydrolase
MTIEPWRATCIQTASKLAVKAAHRDGAWAIIDENIAHALALIEAATQSADPPKLVVLPEFAFQGPPHGLPVANWIEKACCAIPGRITAPLQNLAHRAHIYVAAHQFESDPQWPGRYFNTSFLIDPTGAVILRYRRVNTAAFPSPHDFMDAYLARYSMAEIFPVVDTELGRLAMIPCGEINVPEVARVLMMQGVEVIRDGRHRRPPRSCARPRTWSTSSARMSPKASDFRGMTRCGAVVPTSSTISAGHWPTRTAREKPRRSRR